MKRLMSLLLNVLVNPVVGWSVACSLRSKLKIYGEWGIYDQNQHGMVVIGTTNGIGLSEK